MNTNEPEDITVDYDNKIVTITMTPEQAERLEKEGRVKFELGQRKKYKLLDAGLALPNARVLPD